MPTKTDQIVEPPSAKSNSDHSSIDALAEATITALKQQNQLLDNSYKSAEERLSREWRLPKAVLIAISFLGGGFAIFSFWQQYVVISELSRRSGRLEEQLTKSDETLKTTEDLLIDGRSRLDQTLSESREKFERDQSVLMDKITGDVEGLLNESLSELKSDHSAIIDEMVRTQRILSLVSMGREQIFLKRNPVRGLVFADAANSIYNESLTLVNGEDNEPPRLAANTGATEGSVMVEVYPAIWNLQLECLLHLKQFSKIDSLVENIIGSRSHACLSTNEHCVLRSAFYYRALSGINRITTFNDRVHASLVNSPARQASLEQLISSVHADLASVIGHEPDLSIGMVYQGLLYLIEGKYRQCENLLTPFEEAANDAPRTSPEGLVNTQLAVTTLEMCRSIMTSDQTFNPVICNLGRSALSEVDATLLEQTIANIIQNRHWHMQNIDPSDDDLVGRIALANQLGVHCVDWILALRQACESTTQDLPIPVGAGCTNCGGDSTTTSTTPNSDLSAPVNAVEDARANLLANFSLRANPGSPIYSKNRNLGRIVGGFRWMKTLQIQLTNEVRNRTIVHKGEEVIQSYLVAVPVSITSIAYYDPDMEVRPGPYIPVSDGDLEAIHKKLAEMSANRSRADSTRAVGVDDQPEGDEDDGLFGDANGDVNSTGRGDSRNLSEVDELFGE